MRGPAQGAGSGARETSRDGRVRGDERITVMTLTLEEQLAASILVIRAKKTAGMLTAQEAEDLEKALAGSNVHRLPSAPPQIEVAPAPDSPTPDTMTRPRRRRRSVTPIAEPVNSPALVPEPLPPKMAAKLKAPLSPGAIENHSRTAR